MPEHFDLSAEFRRLPEFARLGTSFGSYGLLRFFSRPLPLPFSLSSAPEPLQNFFTSSKPSAFVRRLRSSRMTIYLTVDRAEKLPRSLSRTVYRPSSRSGRNEDTREDHEHRRRRRKRCGRQRRRDEARRRDLYALSSSSLRGNGALDPQLEIRGVI